MAASEMIRPLNPPTGVGDARERADEILRLWIVDRAELAATFPTGLYGGDVWKWGRVLANLARYIARAEAQAGVATEAEILDVLRVNFDEEVRRTGEMFGGVQARRDG
jgi:hypothetical protein